MRGRSFRDYDRHFPSLDQQGRIWRTGFSPKVILGVVKQKAKDCEIQSLAPHDLRRTCARLCHQAGGEPEQIQFLLEHVSVSTAERYLGCKQRFHNAVNDPGRNRIIRSLHRFHPAGRLPVINLLLNERRGRRCCFTKLPLQTNAVVTFMTPIQAYPLPDGVVANR